MTVDFSLESEAFQEDPAGTFAALRAECPVHHASRPAPHYTVSRHADVTEVLRNSDVWKSRFGPGLAHRGGGVLVSSDPPKHTTERLAITKVFRPSAIDELRDDIGALVDGIVDGFAPLGEGDLVELLGMPVPLTVMCWLLGTPVEDIGLFRSWVLPMAEGVSYADGRLAPDVAAAYQGFNDYFVRHVDARARAVDAGDDVPDDLLTRLMTVERDGKRLSREDVLGFCQFLLVAGSATTTLLIGNVVERLLRHPDQMALVRADRSLIEPAIEESLRIDAPVHGLFRTNDEAVCLHGIEIAPDSKVLALFGSANLDPAVWDEPDRFDVTRDLSQLRKHYAFGVGIHYCLGAPLARMEAHLAVEAVLDRLPNLRLTGRPKLVKAAVLKGYEELPVAWERP
jgi:cytochrome P450